MCLTINTTTKLINHIDIHLLPLVNSASCSFSNHATVCTEKAERDFLVGEGCKTFERYSHFFPHVGNSYLPTVEAQVYNNKLSNETHLRPCLTDCFDDVRYADISPTNKRALLIFLERVSYTPTGQPIACINCLQTTLIIAVTLHGLFKHQSCCAGQCVYPNLRA
jgi:hypothetical protein